ncbi:hypothetical protein WISP_134152 [Willisornis vidua]|uniref:Uncharacterized protein n=1 Tax=Willisornis vidua TaxID=1566151 RepID=A0ABQ9CNW7_9PASS|nr:hypothetical protein WISP_134152 [Willisornis vidua]
MLEGRGDIQGNLDRPLWWVCVNLCKFNKVRSKVLHLCQCNPKHKYRLGGEWIETNPEDKDQGMDVGWCDSAMCTCNPENQHVLSCIQSSETTGQVRRFFPSTLLRSVVTFNVDFEMKRSMTNRLSVDFGNWSGEKVEKAGRSNFSSQTSWVQDLRFHVNKRQSEK